MKNALSGFVCGFAFAAMIALIAVYGPNAPVVEIVPHF
jgi:hypothetical protein